MVVEDLPNHEPCSFGLGQEIVQHEYARVISAPNVPVCPEGWDATLHADAGARERWEMLGAADGLGGTIRRT